ncbi:MAG: hypothetical protein ACXU8R_14870 [Xanthobacteraceae bacterium]
MGKLPVRTLGIPWYRREDYPRILEIMEDARILPLTFDEWQRKAEGVEHISGAPAVRVMIDPDEFLAWCAREGRPVDGKARATFAAEGAARHQAKNTTQ